jgi:HEPN domain-containing protein
MHVPLDERVAAWFAAADSDMHVAVVVRDTAAHIACFHAQQSAEKALKALVTRLSGDAPPLHAMIRLLAALDALDALAVPPEVRDDAEALDKYYIPTRYPDALGFVDASLTYKRRDADLAIESAQRVLNWARSSESDLRSGPTLPER